MVTINLPRKVLVEISSVDFFTNDSDYLEDVLYKAYKGALKPRCRKLPTRGPRIPVTLRDTNDWWRVFERMEDIIDEVYDRTFTKFTYELKYFLERGKWEDEDKQPRTINHEWHQEVDDHIKNDMEIMAQYLASVTPGLPSNWKPNLKISWRTSGISRGGWHRGKGGLYNGHGGVSIAPERYFTKDGEARDSVFREYKHIGNRKTIGDVHTSSWELQISTLVAHEIAHAAQFYLGFNKRKMYPNIKSPAHGSGWQELYRTLREAFINGNVDAEKGEA